MVQSVCRSKCERKSDVIFSGWQDGRENNCARGYLATLLCAQVHVAYQTSGNIAVWDEDVLRFADFAAQFGAAMGIESSHAAAIAANIETFLNKKSSGQVRYALSVLWIPTWPTQTCPCQHMRCGISFLPPSV